MSDMQLAEQANSTALEIASAVSVLAVTDAAGYEAAGAQLFTAKTSLKRVEELEKKVTTPLNQALKAARDLFAPAKTRIKEAIAQIERPMAAYKLAEAQAIREAEAEAEARRNKAIAQAHEAMARAENAADPVDAMLAQEDAEAALNTLRCPNAEPVKARAAGTAARSYWRAEVFDATLLPREYMLPDLSKLNSIASSLKGNAPEIAGVRWVQEFRIVGR